MTAPNLENWILANYQGIIVKDAYRERSFFYNPDGSLPIGIYFATIKESDGPNDKASQLNRTDCYRLSVGVGKPIYQNLFGDIPARPAKGGIIDYQIDFTSLDILMPHPIYAWLGWVAINNPSQSNMETVEYLLDISYQNVLIKFKKKK
jgi:hypothetical protein